MAGRSVTTDRPAPVAMNLDTLEVEGRTEPFVFVAGGQRFVVESIEDHDWQDLMSFDGDDAEASIRVLLGDDQFDRFKATKGVSMRKMRVLFKAIQDHFGLGDVPEGDASPGS